MNKVKNKGEIYSDSILIIKKLASLTKIISLLLYENRNAPRNPQINL